MPLPSRRHRAARRGGPGAGLREALPPIRTENGQLAVYIFFDIAGRDLGSYVADARQAVANEVKFPAGNYVTWSGQFEYLEVARPA